MNLTLTQRRMVRAYATNQTNIRIEVVPGNVAPHLAGRSYYWTTPSGKTEVHHPMAYRWPTWYHASTRRVVVGEQWLAAPVMTLSMAVAA